jgi:DNA repair exonuclease SbcCD ATPase subunit
MAKKATSQSSAKRDSESPTTKSSKSAAAKTEPGQSTKSGKTASKTSSKTASKTSSDSVESIDPDSSSGKAKAPTKSKKASSAKATESDAAPASKTRSKKSEPKKSEPKKSEPVSSEAPPVHGAASAKKPASKKSDSKKALGKSEPSENSSGDVPVEKTAPPSESKLVELAKEPSPGAPAPSTSDVRPASGPDRELTEVDLKILSLERDREEAVNKRDEALVAREALQKERDQAARSRVKAEEERAAMEAASKALRAQLDELKQDAESWKQRFEEEANALNSLRKGLEAADKAAGSAGMSRGEFAEIEQDRNRLRKSLEDERRERKTAETSLTGLKERYASLLERNKRLDEKVQELMQAARLSDGAEAAAQLKSYEQRIADLEQRLIEAPSIDQLRELELELATATDQRDALRTEIAKLRGGEGSSEVEALRNKLTRMTEDRNVFRGRAQRLELTISKLKEELEGKPSSGS